MAQQASHDTTSKEAPLLEVSDLGKRYTADKAALEDVDLTAHPGELISVIGCSGAGKSTLLRCINRLIEPTSGTIMFEGQDIAHLRGTRRLRPVHRKIAMIFQGYNLVYRLSALQNVLHGRLGYKGLVQGCLGLYSEQEKVRALDLLDEVGLGEFAYRRADQLSGGQKQRVGIARALIQDPRIILCDEPIASLDPKSSRLVMEHLRRVARQKGITCIVNLHQVDFALEFSDRIVGLRLGRKVYEGTPSSTSEQDIRDIYGGLDDDYLATQTSLAGAGAHVSAMHTTIVSPLAAPGVMAAGRAVL